MELDVQKLLAHQKVQGHLEGVIDATKVPKGFIKVAKDPRVLQKVDGLQIPSITNTTKFQKADRRPHPLMDKIDIK